MKGRKIMSIKNNNGYDSFIDEKEPMALEGKKLDEVFEKITLKRIVAVAKHGLPSKVFAIIAHLLLNIRQLRVKFVFLVFFRIR